MPRPSREGNGTVDMQALPAAVRRQLSRPRWCPDFVQGCCKKDHCPLPDLSETVVPEIKDKDSVYKAAAVAKTASRGQSVGKKGKADN